MLYYCAVKGQEMGFGELHKHLAKYVRSPAKRYWYVTPHNTYIYGTTYRKWYAKHNQEHTTDESTHWTPQSK